MPPTQANAPAWVPKEETIEYLLNKPLPKDYNKDQRSIKTLSQLSLDQRSRTGLCMFGKTTKVIPGDPYAYSPYWAGNVSHPLDVRMEQIMPRIFKKLSEQKICDTPFTRKLQKLLLGIPSIDIKKLPQHMAAEQTYTLVCDNEEETTITFELHTEREERITVRITQAHDLRRSDKRCYSAAARSRRAEKRVDEHLNEEKLETFELQGIMAKLFIDTNASWSTKPRGIQNYLYSLRAAAQQRFWLELSPEGRRQAREAATTMSDDPKFREVLDKLKQYWSTWTHGAKEPDRFRQYLRDESAAKAHSVWPLVTEDIYIVTDKERKVVVAVAQELTQLVYSQQTTDILTHALDMWTYFAPIPAPESRRHVVDEYIRKIHHELDPEQQTVETLQSAKQGVAHLGCWARAGDPHGTQILKTKDTKFTKSYDTDFDLCIDLLPGLFQHVFSKIANVVRFLMKPLDPEYYQDAIDIFNNLPKSRKVSTGEEDFNHLFALCINAYTQRHCDTNDVVGGLAGIVTLGQYSGGNLCLPQLGVQVLYLSGTAVILRGDGLEHRVADFTPPRAFIVCTNHQSCKEHAWRKLGRPTKRSLTYKPSHEAEDNDDHENIPTEDKDEDEDTDPLYTTCINNDTDETDPDFIMTNKILHDSGALPSSGSSTTPGEDSG